MRKVLFIGIILICVIFVYNCAAEQEQQKMLAPKEVKVDSNYDGKVDRIEHYDDNGQVVKAESDTDADGTMDEWTIFKNGQPLRGERDTNGDGKPDIWIEY